MTEQPTKALPSLTRLRSEYQELCENDSGEICLRPGNFYHDAQCSRHPYGKFSSLLERWQSDFITCVRHWPWAAFAVDQYQFRTKEAAKVGLEPTPTEIKNHLLRIAKLSADLTTALCTLQEWSLRVNDETSPLRRGHLQWIDAMLKQSLSGAIAPELDDSPHALLSNFEVANDVCLKIIDLEVMAKSLAEQRLAPDLLSRLRSQPDDPALWHTVSIAKRIWESMTGRKASAAKVETNGIDQPAFVEFVSGLVTIAGGPQPSRKQVETALKRCAPPLRSIEK